MNIEDMKTTLLNIYPHIELIYDKTSDTLKFDNIVSSMRFGMGYRWNLILYFENLEVVKKEFECCTFDNSSVHFCKVLEPTHEVTKKAKKILTLVKLI